MGRTILFITTDQQRYEALGCNGGTIARTPGRGWLGTQRSDLPPCVQPEHGLLAYYEGRWQNAEGGPLNFRVPALTPDQIREINAKVRTPARLLVDAPA